MDRDICKLSLAAVSVTSKYAHDYINMRLKEVWYPKGAKAGRPITPRTVRREINSISRVFSTAKQKWVTRTFAIPSSWAKSRRIAIEASVEFNVSIRRNERQRGPRLLAWHAIGLLGHGLSPS
jgi:hypothetical protein